MGSLSVWFSPRLVKLVLATIFFVIVFSFFLAKNHFYQPAQLHVEGSFDSPEQLIVRWDSGTGFNPNEKAPNYKEFQLPQRNICGIKIEPADPSRPIILTSVKVVTGSRSINLPLDTSMVQSGSYTWTDIDLGTRSPNAILLTVQFLLALFLTWIAYELLGLKQKLGKPDWRSVFQWIFVADKHWVFWAMFLFSTSVFSLWLLGHWPGAMSPDSLDIWNQSITLTWSNWHPWLNEVYILALRQFRDTPAVVAIFQIVATASLGSYIFYYSLKKGARHYLVWPFFGLFVLSVPVALYNIILWKDIPSSLMTLFFAFLFFNLWIARIAGEPCHLGLVRTFLLSLCLVFFGMMRHNGIILILFIPFLGAVTGLVPLKRGFTAFSLAIFIVLNYGVGNLLGVHQRTNYDILNFIWKAGPLYGLFSNPTGYYATDPELDKKIMSRHVDLVFLRERYRRAFIDSIFFSGKINLSKDVLRELRGLYYKRVPDNLALLMGDRTYCFVTAMLPTHEAETWGATLQGPGWQKNSPWEQRTNVAYLVRIPRSDFLARTQATIIEKTTNYTGILSGRAVFWNNLIPLLLLTAVLALYKWLPGSALFSLVILVQVPFLFLTVGGGFRYYYFVYLAGFFVVPIVSAELHQRRLLKKGC